MKKYEQINFKKTEIKRVLWLSMHVDISTMLFFINYKQNRV